MSKMMLSDIPGVIDCYIWHFLMKPGVIPTIKKISFNFGYHLGVFYNFCTQYFK